MYDLRVCSKIDAVLLSHSNTVHLGALPYAMSHLGLYAPIFSTEPVHRLGLLTMYDHYLSRKILSWTTVLFAGIISWISVLNAKLIKLVLLVRSVLLPGVTLTLLVVIWGLRLGIFLLMRILQWGEDRRFDEMRSNIGRLAVFWIFQAVWVWTVSLPVTFVNASNNHPSLQAVDIIGWIMFVIGFSMEATADQQKLVFKNSTENRGKWCNVGVWKFSRHPNYFGEILLWWGIFVSSTSTLKGAEWLVIFGPIFLTLLLLFVSGIPLLEKSADKKFSNRADYKFYKKTTSPLIPMPPFVYDKLPSWFKAGFLFEFPLYSRTIRQNDVSDGYSPILQGVEESRENRATK